MTDPQGFTILPVSEQVLSEAAEIMRELRAAGQGIGVADGIIAATARLYGLPLVTATARHFKRIASLDVRGYMPAA